MRTFLSMSRGPFFSIQLSLANQWDTENLHVIQNTSQTDNLPQVKSQQGKGGVRGRSFRKSPNSRFGLFKIFSWLVLISCQVPLSTWAVMSE